MIKTIKIFRLSNLDSIGDDNIRNVMKSALDNLNPIPYLKKCKHLLIGYYPSILGQAEGLYSLGLKKVSCSKKKTIYFGGSIQNLYEIFKKNFCNSCEKGETRAQDYDPPSIVIEEMVKEIHEIEEENKLSEI